MNAKLLLLPFFFVMTVSRALYSRPSAAQIVTVQSQFRGPFRSTVWHHWQPSWNVEEHSSALDQAPEWKLTRGYDGAGQPVVELLFRTVTPGLHATLEGEILSRSGTWSVQRLAARPVSAEAGTRGEWQVFIFANASDFVDRNERSFSSLIRFKIRAGDHDPLVTQEIRPMFVRGRELAFWNNSMDEPYLAHAGSGHISIAHGAKTEGGTQVPDTWNGVPIQPKLEFIERNTMGAGALIGLHRHEFNQELYLVESGTALMRMGVSPISSERRTVQRPFHSNSADTTETVEVDTAGGWIEERLMGPGQISVIVPTPGDGAHVYFHGIEASTDTVFWTMGTKN